MFELYYSFWTTFLALAECDPISFTITLKVPWGFFVVKTGTELVLEIIPETVDHSQSCGVFTGKDAKREFNVHLIGHPLPAFVDRNENWLRLCLSPVREIGMSVFLC